MRGRRELDLQLSSITKVYPGVVALEEVSLHVRTGEVIGLLGENGAGKSTLMKVLGGIVAPTTGSITIDGEAHDRFTVIESQAAGIAFVHQELNVLDNLDVTANIFLGREKAFRGFGLVDSKSMYAEVQPLLDRVGARFGPTTSAAELSLAEQQLLEIAKALSTDARLIIMDEPTSSLTLSETSVLLNVIADLKAQGIAVIFISHRLSEVEQCVDRAVVLRDGKLVGHLDRTESTHDNMIRLMIGRDLKSLYTPPAHSAGEPVLSLRDVRTRANPASAANLDVYSGEILGVAGLIGAGRTELAQAIFGIGGKLDGEVYVDGQLLNTSTPEKAIEAGLYLVPEDRKRAGLILDFDIAENVTMANLKDYARNGIVSRKRQVEAAETQRRKLAIKTPDVRHAAHEMSGGNQQKVVLAKWLSMSPRIIIFDEPTRGIDVGAKSEIYRLMRELADNGVGVMMISSDMEEVIGVSDRIIVMKDGQFTGTLQRKDFSEHNILTLAVGRALQEV